MIRAIGAVDDRLGLATDDGIPWKVPADVEHFRFTVASSDVLMGYATYAEFERPLPGSTNFVAARPGSTLRHGFVPVADLDSFLAEHVDAELWVIGGATVYARTLPTVQELSLTRVEGDFGCTKFFPPFESAFRLVSDDPSPPVVGTPNIRFQLWRRHPGPEERGHRA
ncbi:MAG: dihydrofolate reductase [Acidimicrobiales bacterium]|jgi:dihydrofolate reductase